MLAYFLKVNVAIVLFYAFYRLFFYKDTFFGWRRAALLCFFAVSAAVPLLNIKRGLRSRNRWWPWQTSMPALCYRNSQ